MDVLLIDIRKPLCIQKRIIWSLDAVTLWIVIVTIFSTVKISQNGFIPGLKVSKRWYWLIIKGGQTFILNGYFPYSAKCFQFISGKIDSHFRVDNFHHFKFYHDRKNNFSSFLKKNRTVVNFDNITNYL